MLRTRKPSTRRRICVVACSLVAIVLGTQSCINDNTQTVLCNGSWRCPPGWTCAAFQENTCIDDGCGDGVLDRAAGESCDDGNILDGDGCSSDCSVLEGCGNMSIEDGEICDDGNITSGDGCSGDCLSQEECGNGYRDVDEVCDDGNTESGDGCKGDCSLLETCGDGNRDFGEVCDDGNVVSGDGCSADCISNEICRNEYVDKGEECDDGPEDTPECDSIDCTAPICGDGYTNKSALEQCDDGNKDNTDNCPDGDGGTCQPAYCGDGFVHDGVEQCEDGNNDNTDACPDGVGGTCELARCGDGHTYSGVESCDDGDGDNKDNCPDGDGGTCQVASCGDGFINKEGPDIEQCDDGNNDNTDDCPDGVGGTCQPAECGDGHIHSDDEDCEEGAIDTSTCDLNCTKVECGDGHLNKAANEECDDNNTDNYDNCVEFEGTCRNAFCGDEFVDKAEPRIEACDEGAIDTADCDSDCTAVQCGDGYINGAADEQCDDNNTDNDDNCVEFEGTCRNAFCGDSFIDQEEPGIEVCDDGAIDTENCDSDCTAVQCGDGHRNEAAGEECDDNNTNNSDSCVEFEGTCRNAFCGDGFIHVGVEDCENSSDCEGFATCNGNTCTCSSSTVRQHYNIPQQSSWVQCLLNSGHQDAGVYVLPSRYCIFRF